MSADIDGDFVVFLIGASPDKFHLGSELPGSRRTPWHEAHARLSKACSAIRRGSLPSCSTGAPSIISRRSPTTPATRTWSCDTTTGNASAPPAELASDTRHTWSGRVNTKRSAGTCRVRAGQSRPTAAAGGRQDRMRPVPGRGNRAADSPTGPNCRRHRDRGSANAVLSARVVDYLRAHNRNVCTKLHHGEDT